MEEIIKKAYNESLNKNRFGDKLEEIKSIQNKILYAKKIIISTNNNEKFKIIHKILISLYTVYNKNIPLIEKLDISTYAVDLTRFPAINKGLIGVDTTDGDIIISRGRLGVPGSGSMLVILDNKGRCLSASLSPSSLIHKNNIEKTVEKELINALNRVGLKINGK